MEPAKDKVRLYNTRLGWVARDMMINISSMRERFYWLVSLCALLIIWQVIASRVNNLLFLPRPLIVGRAFISALADTKTLQDLLTTLRRVMTGFLYALAIGVPLGVLMGYSTMARKFVDPLIDSVRQIPLMAWVPLTIVWFGLGDGPTLFLIAFVGLFPILLNTIAGVQSVSGDYINAARSMGASTWSIFAHIIAPGATPDILTGMRVALGVGWMSVI